ncbi:hypothetical protein D3C71_1742770 [compost metagenome]
MNDYLYFYIWADDEIKFSISEFSFHSNSDDIFNDPFMLVNVDDDGTTHQFIIPNDADIFLELILR